MIFWKEKNISRRDRKVHGEKRREREDKKKYFNNFAF